MIPLRDNIRPRRRPLVNYLILGCTTAVFVAQLLEQPGEPSLAERYGMIPARVLDPERPIFIREPAVIGGRVVIQRRPAAEPPVAPWLTLLTCVFLHGGWLHFLGNMWFLHIFGDNVEDRLGHLGFLAFYLLTGVAASAAHLATNPSSEIPTIGASGAIAGVMGAYLLLYPQATVLTAVPIFFFIQIIVVPAPVFLGIWFLLQFFQGTLAITAAETGGVAWWAHIGGFVAGAVVVWALRATGHISRRQGEVIPNTERLRHYRYRR
jgi:membrane associated rhomboid family serine protease